MKKIVSLTFLAGLLSTSALAFSGPGGTNPVPPPPPTSKIAFTTSFSGPGGTNPVPPPPPTSR